MSNETRLQVGDRLPELARTIELPDMVAYAGATWDWHRLHYDPAYLASKGIPTPVIDGQVFGALLVEQLQDSLGPRAFVRRLEFRFKNLVFAGETVSCVSTVTEMHESDDTVVLSFDCEVVVVGDNARVAVGPASAVVVLPR
jgi:acyl dehydratase